MLEGGAKGRGVDFMQKDGLKRWYLAGNRTPRPWLAPRFQPPGKCHPQCRAPRNVPARHCARGWSSLPTSLVSRDLLKSPQPWRLPWPLCHAGHILAEPPPKGLEDRAFSSFRGLR
ncbi:hypothetical protein H696_00933 [Fonticula alba]|uniref:Uncharacterized protein n=1 Tax=Fonticula alba TaxID=691883 RepID=A0A058ZG72_FONAL|nr:hypothetical protein H696_00933 [Fonticula alba]KCV73395.1 hypothetical protein H696_00933 [Fonticula alba]|eukprot:XP_009493096.1 hypothetical protein H696_00933 [Fonticula alba]